MKLSQLKKILKESAKEAVIEVLNEISAQQQYVPQKINESFVSPQLAHNLRNMFAPPVQQYVQPQTYSQPHQTYPQQNQQPIVPKVMPTPALGGLLGSIASSMTAEDYDALNKHQYE